MTSLEWRENEEQEEREIPFIGILSSPFISVKGDLLHSNRSLSVYFLARGERKEEEDLSIHIYIYIHNTYMEILSVPPNTL